MRILVALTLISVALAGCISDEPTEDKFSEPEPDTEQNKNFPDIPSSLTHLSHSDVGAVDGLWVEHDLAFLSGPSGLRIMDVHNPDAPTMLAETIDSTTGSRDVDLLFHENGRTYAVVAKSSNGIALIDVTIPEDSFHVSEVTNIGSAHNLAVVPGTMIVYNSRSISEHVPEPGSTGQIDIIDFSIPSDPVVNVFNFPAVAMTVGGIPRPVVSTTCHDITFTPSNERAYCAGVTDTQIWDVSEPSQPSIIQVIDWPGNQIHHGAWGVNNGDLLIIGDEFAGAAAGPVCTPMEEQPYAALWFWDISDLANPMPLGSYNIPYEGVLGGDTALCTTHFGTPMGDKPFFVIGWYTAGITIVDFSDPSAPTTAVQWRAEGETNTWEARAYKGNIYTGDTVRGMDILRVE